MLGLSVCVLVVMNVVQEGVVKMMDDRQRALQLLSILYSEIERSEIKAQLGRKYFDIVKRTDVFLELQELINQAVTYNDEGKKLIFQSEHARQAAGNGIENGLQTLKNLRTIIEKIHNQSKKTYEEIENIIPKANNISLLLEKDEWKANVFYDALINALTYVIAVQHGIQALSDVYYQENMNLLSKIRLVEDVLFPKLNNRGKGHAWWIIRSRKFEQLGMGQYYGYGKSFVNGNRDMQSLTESLDQNKEKFRKVSPTLYVAKKHDPMAYNAAVMLGRGYIVGREVSEAAFLLEDDVITEPPIDTLENIKFEGMDIIQALDSCLGTKNYCISPDVLIEMLNRRQINEATETRLANKQCIFCGKEVKNGQAYCSEHFHVNQ